MLASRAVKPKLSLNISSATSSTSRPTLSLKSPMTMAPMRSPISPAPVSPSPISPTRRNTRLNQRGYSTNIVQQPTYAYANPSTSRSILKKSSRSTPSTSSTRRQLSFSETPIVYCVTPIEEPDYYGSNNKKMSRDERRWARRWPSGVTHSYIDFTAIHFMLYWRHWWYHDTTTTKKRASWHTGPRHFGQGIWNKLDAWRRSHP